MTDPCGTNPGVDDWGAGEGAIPLFTGGFGDGVAGPADGLKFGAGAGAPLGSVPPLLNTGVGAGPLLTPVDGLKFGVAAGAPDTCEGWIAGFPTEPPGLPAPAGSVTMMFPGAIARTVALE